MNRTIAAAIVAAIIMSPATAQDMRVEGVEIEIGADKVVSVGSLTEARPRDFLRFKAPLCRGDDCPSPVLMRIASDGSVVFESGATVDFSPRGFRERAGPRLGFVIIRIDGVEVLLPVFASPRLGGAE